ncbi:hypothetical protein ACJMK2_000130 [Sinanodonta woodiana]|uniref:DZIP3-like HEPN domain-containing protein n=1 Tax=Sinanodonta woodiana TaxID=1069815 RepID=A0ABD3XRP8_SINWO
MQTPTLGSTAANVIQTPTSRPTAANVMQTPTSGSTAANAIQTSTSRSGSTAANVMQTPTLGSTAANVIQTPTSGPTTANIIQTPTSGPAAANVIQTPTPGLTAASVIQTSTSGPTAANVIQTPGSTAANVIQTPTLGPTAAYVIQTPGSTAANVIQTPTSGPTTANIIQTPTSGPTAANVIQTPTPGPTVARAIQTPTSGSTAANAMQTPTSGSTIANVIQTTGPTAANVIQTPGSTAANIIQTTPSVPATLGSIPSTTTGRMPVMSSCYTAGGLPPQAMTIQSTTTNVSQAPSLDDTGRFVHIACLLVNVGSRVLRRLLLYHTVKPTRNLDQYLAKKRIDIDNLRKRKIINKSQMDILYPPGGCTNLGDYDITLLSALFTNIVNNISQQQLNMIQFLRDKRNEIFAHAKSVTVNSNDYQTFWNDICSTLEALCKQCNDPDFKNEISREIQAIQVTTFQGTSLPDALQTHRKIESLEKLVQYLMSSRAQESNKESDDSDS